ncbi:PilZ domain-containing protein [Novosphingobium soli]|uniref:PilZ domain-containing protein n=1 Tax=Novosphingobium soli TaxID=574956 RepID=A0ABV6CUT2_9SPHN
MTTRYRSGSDGDDRPGDLHAQWGKAASLALPQSLASARGTGDHPHRCPRMRTLICAVAGTGDAAGVEVIVRNVSPGGMCIASRTLLPRAGDTLHITLPGQAALSAQVRWVGDGEFGVQLLDGQATEPFPAACGSRGSGLEAALGRVLGMAPRPARGSTGTRPCAGSDPR